MWHPDMCNSLILSLKIKSPIQTKEENLAIMPKATQKSVVDVEEAEEETPLHGAINEEEAKTYRKGLDKVFDDLAKNIKDNIANAMELAIIDLKTHITKHITGAEEVDTGGILKHYLGPNLPHIKRTNGRSQRKIRRNFTRFRDSQWKRYYKKHQ